MAKNEMNQKMMEMEGKMEEMEMEDMKGMKMEDMKEMKKMMEMCNTRPCMKEAKDMCDDMKDEMEDTCEDCISGFVNNGGCEGVSALFDGLITLEQLGERVPEMCHPCSGGAMEKCFKTWSGQCKKDCGGCKDTFEEAGGCPALMDPTSTMDLGDCSECMECSKLMCFTSHLMAVNKTPLEFYLSEMMDAQKKGDHLLKFSHFK